MGPGQISLLQQFTKHSKIYKEPYAFKRISDLGHIGFSDTAPHGKLVVDSACSATQIAIGKHTLNEVIGLDKHGDPAQTILEKARDRGMLTGLVSDTRLTHATPASFASHAANRKYENEIALEMVQSNANVLFSGGARHFYPQGTQLKVGDFEVTSRRDDDKNPIQIAKSNGYQIIHTKNDLNNISGNKVLGLFTNGSFPNSIWFHDKQDDEKRAVPSLLEMTKSALGLLDSNNKKGFFLMVEAGQIDWAGHQNDAGTMLHEMVTMNDTLNYLIDYVQKNPDTLLVVTADHETGSFGLGYHAVDVPAPKKIDGKEFKDKDYEVKLNYGNVANLDKLFMQKNSFENIVKEFLSLEASMQTADTLMSMVNEVSHYKISLEDAKRIITPVKNKYFKKDDKYLGKEKWMDMIDYQAYYLNPINNITALINEAIAHKANIVWGTGGHTSNPVHVYSMGPKYWSEKLSGNLNHPKLGKLLQKSLGLWE
tara:strand:+ start:151617 stop:153062 length:1446 start_codon:yes stop_codon:yes gene_type:complete